MNSLLRAPTRIGRTLEALFLLHAALLPVSIAAGQVWAYLIAVVTIIGRSLGAFREAARSPLAPLIFAFVGAALFSVLVGVRPELALRKADRLLLMAVALAAPMIAGASQRMAAPDILRRMLILFLIGCTGKAIYDLVRIPLKYVLARRAYEAALAHADAAGSLIEPTIYAFGNMRDPQFYAAAICIAMALRMFRTPGFPTGALMFSIFACGGGMAIHFKRGAWLALIATLFFMALITRRWRMIAIVLALLAIGVQVPMIRERISLLQQELQVRTGGRLALWQIVAPALYHEYPLGMGWRSVTHHDLQRRGAPVQERLNHLHNNLLHVKLETGWPGLAAWLLLMGGAAIIMARAYRFARRTSSELCGPAFGILGAFVALHVNGLVEYNFGDAEIFMLMNLMMGMGTAVWVRLQPMRSASPLGEFGRATT
jgi:O-antigen ligase